MVWQQWVLLIWYCFRVPFAISKEISKPRPDVRPENLDRARTIGVFAFLTIAAALIALVVTI